MFSSIKQRLTQKKEEKARQELEAKMATIREKATAHDKVYTTKKRFEAANSVQIDSGEPAWVELNLALCDYVTQWWKTAFFGGKIDEILFGELSILNGPQKSRIMHELTYLKDLHVYAYPKVYAKRFDPWHGVTQRYR